MRSCKSRRMRRRDTAVREDFGRDESLRATVNPIHNRHWPKTTEYIHGKLSLSDIVINLGRVSSERQKRVCSLETR